MQADLAAILEELRAREPIFHTPAFGSTPEEWNRALAPEYWEVGASGRIYTRAFILETLAVRAPVDAAAAGWVTSDHAVRELGPATYLFTYTLHQGPRVTRRATLWRRTGELWQILYHQGTVVSDE